MSCLGCRSNRNEVIDGVCVEKKCGVNEVLNREGICEVECGVSVDGLLRQNIGNVCYIVPRRCLGLSSFRLCIGCESGYHLWKGLCEAD